jgi:hypothetical protein
MKKQTARELIGPDDSTMARRCGISRQAVNQWPDELPRKTADAVLAARLRLEWSEAAHVRRNRIPAKLTLTPLILDALSVNE